MCEQGVYVSHKLYINVQWLFNLIAAYMSYVSSAVVIIIISRAKQKKAGKSSSKTALKMPFRLHSFTIIHLINALNIYKSNNHEC